MKLKKSDLGKFVTVYFRDEGKRDGILLELLGDTDARVFFPASTDEDTPDTTEVDCENQIIAVGPKLVVTFPRF